MGRQPACPVHITPLSPAGFPEHVELAPLPLWQPVGEELNLSCLVSGGAPRAHLSVVLLRGEEELARQPVGKGEPAEVMFTVQPRREDHGTNFSCRWELDLRSQGLELFQNTSAPRKLQTYGEALGSQQRRCTEGDFLLGMRGPWEAEAPGHGAAEKVATLIAKASGKSIFLATGVECSGLGACTEG